MRRRRRIPQRMSHERWLVSYADFITLLFAFFVVLYSSSQVDKRKVGMLALAIQVAFQQMGVFQASTTQVPIDETKPMPFSTAQAVENTERTASLGRIASAPTDTLGTAVGNGELSQLQSEIEKALASEIDRKEIAIRYEPDGLVISLREVGFFPPGSAEIKTASQSALDRIANMLREHDYRLRIEGHTDKTPIHSAQFASNWELSTARATQIVRLLIVRNGFSPDRLSAAGYAEYHPVATNLTPEGRGMNRRVDVIILRHAAEVPAAQAGGETQKQQANPVSPDATGRAKPNPTAKQNKPSPVAP